MWGPDDEWARTVGRLAPVIAHDLGNVLGALELRLRLLSKHATTGAAGGPEQIGALEALVAEAGELVAELRGRHGGAVASVRVEACVRTAVERVRAALRIAGAGHPPPAFRLGPGLSDAPDLIGDEHELRLAIAAVLLELGRAPDATATTPSIVVSAHRLVGSVGLLFEATELPERSSAAAQDARWRPLRRWITALGGSLRIEAKQAETRAVLRLPAASAADEPLVRGDAQELGRRVDP